MDAKQIGLFLYKLRKEQGLTQKDISVMTNVTAQAVSKWERGESIPDIEILEKLSLLYKVSINELITGEKQERFTDTTLRRTIMSLILSVFVFLVYLFPYIIVRTPDLFPGIVEIGITFKGYYLIFNGLSGPVVISAMVVFFLLLSHVFLNILLILDIINRKSWITPYLQITILGIFIISVVHLVLKDFYILPQILLILFMSLQFFLITDEENKGIINFFKQISLPKRASSSPDKPSNKRVTILLKTIYWFTFVGYVVAASWMIVYNIQYINQNYSSDEYIMMITVIAFLILLIVFMLRNYRHVFNDVNLVQVLPTLILTSILPVYILIVIVMNNYTHSQNDFMWNYFIQDLLLCIGLFIPPVSILIATKRTVAHSN